MSAWTSVHVPGRHSCLQRTLFLACSEVVRFFHCGGPTSDFQKPYLFENASHHFSPLPYTGSSENGKRKSGGFYSIAGGAVRGTGHFRRPLREADEGVLALERPREGVCVLLQREKQRLRTSLGAGRGGPLCLEGEASPAT